MPEYETVVVDLDGCMTYEDDPSRFEQAVQKASIAIGGDSLSSGSKILRELAGDRPDYQMRDEIEPYLEDAETAIILTGRPAWPAIKDTTEQIIEEHPYDFDDTIMYPGESIDGTEYIDETPGTVALFSGSGIPRYKRTILDHLASEDNNIAFIDDAEDCHELVSDLPIDQYIVDETITPYDED